MKLQDKAIRVINFANYCDPPTQLYKKSKILKFKDNITVNNYLYVHDNLNRHLPVALLDKFDYLHNIHEHSTRNAESRCVKLTKSRTLVSGIHSINGQSARAWNHLQITCSSDNLHSRSRKVCKKILTKRYIDSY